MHTIISVDKPLSAIDTVVAPMLCLSNSMERRKIYFSGMVQGVGFRATTAQIAGRHKVAGFVMNLPDGRVELVVEGAADQITAFLNSVTDRMSAQISKVDSSSEPAQGDFSGFNIRY